MILPERLRDELKIPLGELLPESQANKENILKKIPSNSYIITVGDKTTEKMIDFDLIPSLQIVDGQEKREKREPPSLSGITVISVDNPPGKITSQSIDVIKNAFDSKKPPIRILVNGEEDLLVIPVCIYAPDNSVVLYGQPNEGLVLVRITEEIRNKTQNLLDSMN